MSSHSSRNLYDFTTSSTDDKGNSTSSSYLLEVVYTCFSHKSSTVRQRAGQLLLILYRRFGSTSTSPSSSPPPTSSSSISTSSSSQTLKFKQCQDEILYLLYNIIESSHSHSQKSNSNSKCIQCTPRKWEHLEACLIVAEEFLRDTITSHLVNMKDGVCDNAEYISASLRQLLAGLRLALPTILLHSQFEIRRMATQLLPSLTRATILFDAHRLLDECLCRIALHRTEKSMIVSCASDNKNSNNNSNEDSEDISYLPHHNKGIINQYTSYVEDSMRTAVEYAWIAEIAKATQHILEVFHPDFAEPSGLVQLKAGVGVGGVGGGVGGGGEDVSLIGNCGVNLLWSMKTRGRLGEEEAKVAFNTGLKDLEASISSNNQNRSRASASASIGECLSLALDALSKFAHDVICLEAGAESICIPAGTDTRHVGISNGGTNTAFPLFEDAATVATEATVVASASASASGVTNDDKPENKNTNDCCIYDTAQTTSKSTSTSCINSNSTSDHSSFSLPSNRHPDKPTPTSTLTLTLSPIIVSCDFIEATILVWAVLAPLHIRHLSGDAPAQLPGFEAAAVDAPHFLTDAVKGVIELMDMLCLMSGAEKSGGVMSSRPNSPTSSPSAKMPHTPSQYWNNHNNSNNSSSNSSSGNHSQGRNVIVVPSVTDPATTLLPSSLSPSASSTSSTTTAVTALSNSSTSHPYSSPVSSPHSFKMSNNTPANATAKLPLESLTNCNMYTSLPSYNRWICESISPVLPILAVTMSRSCRRHLTRLTTATTTNGVINDKEVIGTAASQLIAANTDRENVVIPCLLLATVVCNWIANISVNALWLDRKPAARKSLFEALPLLIDGSLVSVNQLRTSQDNVSTSPSTSTPPSPCPIAPEKTYKRHENNNKYNNSYMEANTAAAAEGGGSIIVQERSRLYSSRKALASPLTLDLTTNATTTTSTTATASALNSMGYMTSPLSSQVNRNGNHLRDQRSELTVKSSLMTMLMQVLSSHCSLFDAQDITRILYAYRCLAPHLASPPPTEVVMNAIAFYSSRFPLPVTLNAGMNTSASTNILATSVKTTNAVACNVNDYDNANDAHNHKDYDNGNHNGYDDGNHNGNDDDNDDNDNDNDNNSEKSKALSDEFSDWDDEDDELELSTMSNDRGSVLPSYQSHSDQIYALHEEMRRIMNSIRS